MNSTIDQKINANQSLSLKSWLQIGFLSLALVMPISTCAAIQVFTNFFTNLSAQVSGFKQIEYNKTHSNRYAVFINALPEDKHVGFVNEAYETATTKLGFSKENVFVLDDLLSPARPKNKQYPIYGSLTETNFKKLTKDLSQKLSSKDKLLVFVTGHGDQLYSKNKSGFRNPLATLSNVLELINVNSFVDYMSSIDAKIFYAFTGCYEGDFAKRVGVGKNIAISANIPGKESYTFPNLVPKNDSPSEWQLVYRGMANYLFEGMAGAADTNDDDLISAQELVDHLKEYEVIPLLQSVYVSSERELDTIFLGANRFLESDD